MLTFKQEDLSLIPEVEESEFGFNADYGDGIYVLRYDNKVVGFANIEIENKSAHIHEMEILSDFRGLGYGSTFINSLFNYIGIESLSGCSMYDVVDFWVSLGAEIDIPCENCYNYENNCCEYGEDEICEEYT